MAGRVAGRGRTHQRSRGTEAVRITEAPSNRADDIRSRQNKYLLSMALRTVCVVLAVLTVGSWFFWVALLGAVVLPYVAVVVANVAGPRTDGFRLVQAPNSHRQLPAGRAEDRRTVE
jgi:Flp pilus assembly protein TadB